VLLEKLIVEHILPSFPEITKGYTESELKTRLHNHILTEKAVEKITNDKEVVDIMGIDYNQWNSSWRLFELLKIYMEYDDL